MSRSSLPVVGVGRFYIIRNSKQEVLTLVVVLVPYPRNEAFVGREDILKKLQQQPLKSASQPRVALFGLGGVGLACSTT